MARLSAAAAMVRAPSVDSSAPSTIQVASADALDEDSSSERVPASTPPTSLAETNSNAGSVKGANVPSQLSTIMAGAEEEQTGGRRTRRARASVNYNLVELSNAQVVESAHASRNVSGLTGCTLVGASGESEGHSVGADFGDRVEKAMNMDWEIQIPDEQIPDELPPRPTSDALQRKASVKDRLKKAAGKVSSVLGKRSRNMMEAGKRKVEELKGGSDRSSKYLKELDMGVKGVLDEMDFDLDDEDDKAQARPSKKAKKEKSTSSIKPMAPPLLKATSASGKVTAKKGKKWQKEGLYVGQNTDNDRTQAGVKKLQKQRPGSSSSAISQVTLTQPTKRTMLPLPMFGYLGDNKEAEFRIPFDVFAPSFKKGDPKPKDWNAKHNRTNRIVGDAKEIWYKKNSLAHSLCICQPPANGELGCDENCLNRLMHYECNENNCMLNGSGCSNRPFAQLAARMKKGGPYDIGVEVIGTNNRGFGVRACRTFSPGEIIMEYTGEIITEYESERRMIEEYSKSDNYYLMQFDRGLVIDGTKGSMGRFVNHSCAPNCEVRMMRGADNKAHMGIFAGEEGVMTGEELTYDYNFDNFGSSAQKCHCGATSCRGFLSKRLNAAEQKQRDKEEIERQRKAAEEAMKNAEAVIQAKKEKNEKGSAWTGWADLKDPAVLEQLKKEKEARDEAAKNSDRARRMALRRGEVVPPPPTPKAPEPAPKPITESKKPARYDSRRHTSGSTVKTQKSTIRRVPSSVASVRAGARNSEDCSTTPAKRPGHNRTLSAVSANGSRTTENITATRHRPTSSSSATTALLERAISADSNEDELPTPVGKSALTNGDFATAGAVADVYDGPEPETETIAAPSSKTTKSKKRKLGNMLKDAAGAVGIGRGNKRSAEAAEASSNNRTPGKLKQSTLSFSRL
jgi:histone-lysine N-methyltransferase ASH1L